MVGGGRRVPGIVPVCLIYTASTQGSGSTVYALGGPPGSGLASSMVAPGEISSALLGPRGAQALSAQHEAQTPQSTMIVWNPRSGRGPRHDLWERSRRRVVRDRGLQLVADRPPPSKDEVRKANPKLGQQAAQELPSGCI